MTDERQGLPSASAAYRDSNCGANRRLALSAQIAGKTPPEGEDAPRGQVNHRAIETGDLSLVEPEFLDIVKEMRRQFVELTTGFKGRLYVEERFWLTDLKRKIFSAKPDLVLLDSAADSLHFYDWKPTRVPDWDAWEAQINAYAVVLHSLASNVIGHIISNHGTRHYEFHHAATFANLEAELLATLARLKDPDSQPTPGAWCKYCQARLICPALTQAIVKTPDLAADALPRGEAGAQVITKLKMGIRAAYEILDWYTQAIQADPYFVDGIYSLTPGKVSYDVVDKLKAFQHLSKYFSPEALAYASDLSVPRLTELYKESTEVSKKEAQKAVLAILDGLVESKTSKPSLRKR